MHDFGPVTLEIERWAVFLFVALGTDLLRFPAAVGRRLETGRLGVFAPGAVLPGVVGGISIILAFFAFQAIPINYAGFLLIILALVFFILEMKIASYGLLSVAGVTCLLLGSLMLFENDGSGMELSWGVLVPTMAVVSGFFVFVSGLVFKSHLSKPRTGANGLVGEIGVVKETILTEGKVLVHGEMWKAISKVTIEKGTRVRVVRVERLVLEVEPLEQISIEK